MPSHLDRIRPTLRSVPGSVPEAALDARGSAVSIMHLTHGSLELRAIAHVTPSNEACNVPRSTPAHADPVKPHRMDKDS